MEWWIGWFTAGLLGIPAAIYYSLRLKSRWEGNRERRRSAKAEVKEVLSKAIDDANQYEYVDLPLQERLRDTSLPKTLREGLGELVRAGQEYERWRSESCQIVRSEFMVLMTGDFKHLMESLKLFFSFYSIFVRRGGIFRAMCAENLTFEVARQLVLEDRRDWSAKAGQEAPEEERELRLRDVVDGKEFHELIGKLKELESRESIKLLRDVQARFVEQAQAIMREI